MSITLTPNVAALIQRKAETGRYGTADELFVKALQSLEEMEKIEWLRVAIAAGNKGDGISYTPELRAEMREAARRKAVR